MKNYIFILLTLCCSFKLYAKDRLAIINDPDGYTNVRSGPGKQFKVIDTLYAEDFFYFEQEEQADWFKISAWKNRQITGYVHKSRIQDVERLDNEKKKILISRILKQQAILANEFQKGWKSKDAFVLRRKIELHTDTKYDPILSILPQYFCETTDQDIIQIFFATMWANQGSADETPSFTLGECFRCKPDVIIEQLNKMSVLIYLVI